VSAWVIASRASAMRVVRASGGPTSATFMLSVMSTTKT
jgi:hypothetical protein